MAVEKEAAKAVVDLEVVDLEEVMELSLIHI